MRGIESRLSIQLNFLVSVVRVYMRDELSWGDIMTAVVPMDQVVSYLYPQASDAKFSRPSHQVDCV